MFGINKYIIAPVINGLQNFNKTFANLQGVTEAAAKQHSLMSKTGQRTFNAISLGKGSVDVAEAIACKDGLCAVISGIGCAADTVCLLTGFLPGVNYTATVLVPISWGCKSFVFCCKRSSLPLMKSCKP